MLDYTMFVAYWRDYAIVDLPLVKTDQPLFPLSANRTLPWGRHATSTISYRIALAILPYTDIIRPLSSMLSLPTQTQTPYFSTGQLTYLASFNVDENGLPLPASAWMHPSLTAIKAFEIEGDLQKAATYREKAFQSFRKKLQDDRKMDHERLSVLIDWLQGFLPMGCEFIADIILEPIDSARAFWPSIFYTLWQPDMSLNGPLHTYHKYFNNPEESPSHLPLDASTTPPIRTIINRHMGFFTMATAGQAAYTALVQEITSHALLRFAQQLPLGDTDTATTLSNLRDVPIGKGKSGIVVFSDRTSWLRELEQLFSFSETDPADPLLAYPFASSYLQTTGAPLQATALVNDSFGPNNGAYPALRKHTHEMVEQWDAQFRLYDCLEQFAIDLEKAIAGRQQVQEEIDALEFLCPPKNITLLQERVSRWKGRMTELTERLKTKTDPVAQNRLAKSIDNAETKMVFAQMDLSRKMSIYSGEVKFQRLLLASRFPENVLKDTLKKLRLEFDKVLLDRYRCLTIKSPEDIRAILPHIKTDSQQTHTQLTIQSARALRAFAHAAPAYLELFQDYKDLSKKRSHTNHGKKNLSILSKHLFLLYPIRLVPLTHSASFLYELGRSRLQTAIIDGTMPINHLLLAQICSRFSKVVILDAQKEQFSLSTVPQGLDALLRKKHNITDLPPETHG